MREIINKFKRFLQQQDGPTAVEYALMLALIITVMFAAIQATGNPINQMWLKSGNDMNSTMHGGNN